MRPIEPILNKLSGMRRCDLWWNPMCPMRSATCVVASWFDEGSFQLWHAAGCNVEAVAHA